MQTLHEQLKSLEERYWDAVQHKDAEEMKALTDDPCIVVGSQGVAVADIDKMAELLRQADYELKSYEFDDQVVRVRKLTDDVAIIAYQVKEDLIVEGESRTLLAYDATVWVRRGQRWLCALHTETLPGDPFGRDRKPQG
jgi:hypothetical protein